MSSINFWNGKPYHSLNYELKQIFGEKVYRISIDAGFTCPNRDGTLGRGGCIYCNEAGARAQYVNPEMSIEQQIRHGMRVIGQRYRARKFIAYFQAYTNTYAPVEVLERSYRQALKFSEVVGISIGTRPDCIDDDKLKLIEEIAQDYYTIIEYGAQSMHNSTLTKINRCHTVEDTINAIIRTKERKGIQVLAHLIFGLPGEDTLMMQQSVQQLVKLGVDAFKFHHLYIEKRTVAAKLYQIGKITPLDRDIYIDLLIEVISKLPRRIVLHRLFGESNRERLIAPVWTLEKTINLRILEQRMRERGIYQGKHLY